jgi:hypothetical protein
MPLVTVPELAEQASAAAAPSYPSSGPCTRIALSRRATVRAVRLNTTRGHAYVHCRPSAGGTCLRALTSVALLVPLHFALVRAGRALSSVLALSTTTYSWLLPTCAGCRCPCLSVYAGATVTI